MPEINVMGPEHTELSAWLDGELTSEERRRVNARLQADPAYARELEELERTRTMINACMEERSLNPSFLNRLREGENRIARNIRGRRMMAVAGVAAMLALAVVAWQYPWRQPASQPPGAGNQAIAPAQQKTETQEMQQITQAPAKEPEKGVSELPEFELLGTITGAVPQAIIAHTENGKRQSASYAAGDEIIDGITVAEIRKDAVLLDVDGEPITVTKSTADISNPVDRLEGLWKLFLVREERHFERGHVLIERQGRQLKLGFIDENQAVLADYRLSGRELTLYQHDMPDMPAEIKGYLDAEFRKMEFSFTDERTQIDTDAEERYIAEWVAKLDSGSEKEKREAREACTQDVQTIAHALEQYAQAHGGELPENLNLLAPQYLDNENILHDIAEGRFRYRGGKMLDDPPSFPRLNPQPLATFPQRALAHEKMLRQSALHDFIFSKPVLGMDCDDGGIMVYIDRKLSLQSVPLQGAASSVSPGDTAMLSQMRNSCQNRLKQLGLVVKMFENEKGGYAPPGWLTVYPEYLTDPNIVTSPIDPPGTDSYQLLHPAADLESLAADYRLSRQLPEDNPASNATAQSEIPLVVQRSTWPGPNPGKNVLFLDGHVEYIRTDSAQWQGKILPWLK
jgi:prepilin-type processing-associated H-X9-DG protein